MSSDPAVVRDAGITAPADADENSGLAHGKFWMGYAGRESHAERLPGPIGRQAGGMERSRIGGFY